MVPKILKALQAVSPEPVKLCSHGNGPCCPLALRNSRIKYVQYLSDDGHPLRHLTTARICTVRRPTPVAALGSAGQALRNQLLRLFTRV